MFTSTAPGIKLNNYYAEINRPGSPSGINSDNSGTLNSVPPEITEGTLLNIIQEMDGNFSLAFSSFGVDYHVGSLKGTAQTTLKALWAIYGYLHPIYWNRDHY